jgi:hypothetical protein
MALSRLVHQLSYVLQMSLKVCTFTKCDNFAGTVRAQETRDAHRVKRTTYPTNTEKPQKHEMKTQCVDNDPAIKNQ